MVPKVSEPLKFDCIMFVIVHILTWHIAFFNTFGHMFLSFPVVMKAHVRWVLSRCTTAYFNTPQSTRHVLMKRTHSSWCKSCEINPLCQETDVKSSSAQWVMFYMGLKCTSMQYLNFPPFFRFLILHHCDL